MISVIVSLKNRFPHFQLMLRSLVRAEVGPADIDLIVADFSSTDGDVVMACEKAGYRLAVRKVPDPFNRSRVFNEVVKGALGDIYFFLDADMILPVKVFERIWEVVWPGAVYFPECQRQDEQGRIIKDHHCTCGYGICAITPEDFKKVGGWDERFVAWGYSDVDFKNRCVDAGFTIVREPLRGLIHQWHPNTWFHRNRFTAHPGARAYVWEGEGTPPWQR